MEIVFHHEGGYANSPHDPGGETMYGVTKAVFEQHHPGRSVKTITKEEAVKIYKKQYWDKVKGDELPAGIDLCVFDFQVNAGAQSAKTLQRIIKTTADGGIGPKTLAALEKYIEKYSKTTLIEKFTNARLKFYKRLPTFKHFGRGWTRRTNEVRESALQMIGEEPTKKCKSIFSKLFKNG